MMRNFRFTIGGIMAVVLVLAIGFAALKSASGTWAGVMLMLTYGVLGLAIVGAILCRGADQAWWLGFAVFEWGYLYLACGRWSPYPLNELPTLSLMLWLRSQMGEAIKPNSSPVVGLNGMLLSGNGAFNEIAHCLWAVLAATLGGLLARACFASTALRAGSIEPAVRIETDRAHGKPWLRRVVLVAAAMTLFGAVVAIWTTPDAGLWAGGMFLLTCGVLGIAMFGALFSRGRRREIEIGAALFGVGYLYIALASSRFPYHYEEPVSLVTDQFLNAIRPLVPPHWRGGTVNARILAALEQPISMRFFEETRLEDVLTYIKMATSAPDYPGIPIYVDPIGLQEVEKTLRSTVSIDLQGIPLRTTLRLCLKQLGLVYSVEDGCLQINSEDDDKPPERDDPFLIVGHCLLAMIAAAVGGVAAPLVAAARREHPGRGGTEDAPAAAPSH